MIRSAQGGLGFDWRLVATVGVRELRPMCTAPWTLVGLALSVAYLWRLLEGYPVVLGRDSIYIANALAPLALGGFLAGHAVSSRGHRSGALDLLVTLPLPTRRRLTAEFAAGLGITFLAVVFIAVAVIWAMATGATGRPNFGELAGGVAAVWTATTVGSAIGHRFGEVWSIIAPLFVATGVAIFLTGSTTRTRWLGPFVDHPTRLDVVEISRRAPWSHAGYLAALALLVVMIGVTSVRARVAVAVPILIGAGCVWAQLRPASAAEQEAARELAITFKRHECQQRGEIEICLLPGFDGWRTEIEREVQRVASRIPGPPSDAPLVLAQVVDRLPADAYPPPFVQRTNTEIAELLPGRVPLPKYRPMDASVLTSVAIWRVGLPVAPGATYLPPSPDSNDGERAPDLYCADDGARPVVAAWAAVEGTRYAQEVEEQAAAAVSADGSAVSLLHAGAVELSAEQSQLLAALLADDGVAAVLSERIDLLVRPDITLTELRDLAGLTRLDSFPQYPEWIEEPPKCD